VFYTTNDLLLLPNQGWAIRNILPDQGLHLLYGAPGSLKSFMAIDWALSIATGRDWQGHWRVKPGHIVYIASEGTHGIKKRVAAWMQYHKVDEIPNAMWYLNTLDVRDEETVDEFIAALRSRYPPHYQHVEGDEYVDMGSLDLRLIVVDTLSRNFGGEDENSSIAMPKFIAALQQFANDLETSLLIVHHSNALGTRERGHSSLKGAIDASFLCEATRDTNNVLTSGRLVCEKQKDDAQSAELTFNVQRITLTGLPPDEEGERLTSLILTRDTETNTVTQVLSAMEAFVQDVGEANQRALVQHLREGHRFSKGFAEAAPSLAVQRGVLVMRKGEKNNEHLYALPSKSWG
jgi:RecA-family ATPase